MQTLNNWLKTTGLTCKWLCQTCENQENLAHFVNFNFMFICSSNLINALDQRNTHRVLSCNIYWEKTKCISDSTNLSTHRLKKQFLKVILADNYTFSPIPIIAVTLSQFVYLEKLKMTHIIFTQKCSSSICLHF